ncbi:hypothetical protein [Aquisalimonas asiatica]|uniref:Decaheme-associated outer membrane protein, MtrB/PioB family n=1 Tax=Aquisalimonas asiatica TaxID=406100 RepID=A0A1H8TF91_9GAMM|nr:hypothetical protein [Aquisalimonas asiatica]SEO89597.1 hypothetical protein SAMN04488052_104131 [Aquisalimonas asiatica]
MDPTGTRIKTVRILWVLLLLPALAFAEEEQSRDGDWRLRGDTTARMEYYDISGDRELGTYAEDGLQAYQDLNLGLTRGGDGEPLWDIDFSGVVSGSDYRTDAHGARVEYLRLHHENATSPVPYRVDLGDQQAYFSRLSLDRDVRGARVEMQPELGRAEHSLVWLSGGYRRDWYEADETRQPHLVEPEGDYHGASWLVTDPLLGDWSLNVVHHDEVAFTGEEHRHLVTSLAGGWGLEVLRQDLDAQAELARLEGHAWSGVEDDSVRAVDDRGWRASLDGEDRLLPLPLDYSLRYERYGADFQPAGTEVVGDSRALAAAAGLQLTERATLSGRLNRYRDDAATANPIRIDEHGMEVAVPFGIGPVHTNHRVDVLHRERADRVGGIDQLTRRATWDLELPVTDSQETRMNLYWLNLDDRAGGRFARTERRASLAHSAGFRVGDLDVSAAPGVAYRTREGYLEQHTVHPTLSLAAAGALHELGVSLGYRTLERPGLTTPDVDEYQLSMDWRYRMNRHQFGLEYEHQLVEPHEQEEHLDLWRAGAFWRYDFSGGG